MRESILTTRVSIEGGAQQARAAIRSITRSLRTSEKLILFYFAYATVEAMVFQVSFAQRVIVTFLNVTVGFVVTRLAGLNDHKRFPWLRTALAADQTARPPNSGHAGHPFHARAFHRSAENGLFARIRDWFPAVVILLAYREAGLYCLPDPSHYLDHAFVRWDNLLLHNHAALAALNWGAPWLQRYLEGCYTLCYPLVPLGTGALYFLARWPALAAGGNFDPERALDQYWAAVLLALFTCYALFPFFPSTPPRTFFHDLPVFHLSGPMLQPVFRKANFWILEHYGIESSVFPSGHVAAVTAVSLSVRHHWPRAGLLFLFIALSIAIATVVGRYHYTADSIAGALIGAVAFVVSKRLDRAPCPCSPRPYK